MNSGRERTSPTPTRGSMLIKSSRFITDSKKKRSQTSDVKTPSTDRDQGGGQRPGSVTVSRGQVRVVLVLATVPNPLVTKTLFHPTL